MMHPQICVYNCMFELSVYYHVGVFGSYRRYSLMIGFTTSSAVQGNERKTGQYEKIAVCGKRGLLPTTLLPFINERQCIECVVTS